MSAEPVSEACKFSHAWQLTRPWLQYDPVCVLMWCEACRAHPQLGSSVPFVQGTSHFKSFTVKEHEEDEGHGSKGEEGAGEDEDKDEEEEEDVVWLLARAHDGLRTREREGSEWPPHF